MRLAYLSPDVLERLLIRREPPAVSVNDMVDVTYLPWAAQMGRVLDHRRCDQDRDVYFDGPGTELGGRK